MRSSSSFTLNGFTMLPRQDGWTTCAHLRTAGLLGVDPTRCLAFEDSFYGVIAAKAARMKVVAMPDRSEYDQERFSAADLKIRSLEEFTLDTFNQMQNSG